MTMLYADVNSLGEALERIIEEVDVEDDETVTMDVYPADFVMRGITFEEAKDRNLLGALDRPLCGINYDGIRAELHFHENVVEGAFKLRPAGPHDFAVKQAPDPDEIAPSLEPVVEAIEDRFDVISWDFTEVSAASIANAGHFTGFEFKYVVTGV